MNGGNVAGVRYYESSLDIGSVGPATTLDVTVAATGVKANSVVLGAPRSALNAGLGVVGIRTAADQIIVRIMNTTAGALDPAAAAWDFLVFPPLGAETAI